MSEFIFDEETTRMMRRFGEDPSYTGDVVELVNGRPAGIVVDPRLTFPELFAPAGGTKSAFEEAEHPRGQGGKFRRKYEKVSDFMREVLPQAHIVGGAVRDELFGRNPKDEDFVVPGMGHNEIKAALSPHGRVEDLEVGGRHVGLRWYPQYEGAPPEGVEVVPPRREVSTGPGRHDFEIVADANVPLVEDAKRRDFTINALYQPVGPRYFHGTDVELQPGDEIIPSTESGATPSVADATHYSRGAVYLTTEAHLGERYAVGRAGRRGGTPRLYEVVPIGAVTADPEYVESGFGSDQVVAPRARIVREVPLPGYVRWDAERNAMVRIPASERTERQPSAETTTWRIPPGLANEIEMIENLDSLQTEEDVQREIAEWQNTRGAADFLQAWFASSKRKDGSRDVALTPDGAHFLANHVLDNALDIWENNADAGYEARKNRAFARAARALIAKLNAPPKPEASAVAEPSPIIDPLGSGLDDVTNRVLRATSDTSFHEDPLRMVRGLRFISRFDLTPEPQTLQQFRDYAPQIEHVSGERIGGGLDANGMGEFSKLLLAGHPEKALHVARDTGLLQAMLPEANSDDHTLRSIQVAADEDDALEVRLARLFPDRPGAHSALQRLKYPVVMQKRVEGLVSARIDRPVEPTPVRAREFMHEQGDLALDVIAERRADLEATSPMTGQARSELEALASFERLIHEQQDAPTRIRDLAVNGNDLLSLGYQPGPSLGQALNVLLREVILDPERNQRDWLLAAAERHRQEFVDVPPPGEAKGAKGTVQVRPYMRDGHPVSGYTRRVLLSVAAAEEWLKQGDASHRMLLWHGTPSPDKVREMGLAFALDGGGVSVAGRDAVWLSDSRGVAESYGHPIRVAAKFRHALILEQGEDYEDALKREGADVSKLQRNARGSLTASTGWPLDLPEGYDAIGRRFDDYMLLVAFDVNSLRVISTDEKASSIKDTIHVRPYTRDGHPVSGYTRHGDAHVSTKIVKTAAEAAKVHADGLTEHRHHDLDKHLDEIHALNPYDPSGETVFAGGLAISRYRDGLGITGGDLPFQRGISGEDFERVAHDRIEEERAAVEAAWKKHYRGKIALRSGENLPAHRALDEAISHNDAIPSYRRLREWAGIPDYVIPVSQSAFGQPAFGGSDVLTTAFRKVDEQFTVLNMLATSTRARMAAKQLPDGSPMYPNLDAPLRPGNTHATNGHNGEARLLRHEWGHSLFSALTNEHRAEFAAFVPDDVERVKNELTSYAAAHLSGDPDEARQAAQFKENWGPHGNYTEAFSEALAVVTDPSFKPDEWESWVNEIKAWIEGLPE